MRARLVTLQGAERMHFSNSQTRGWILRIFLGVTILGLSLADAQAGWLKRKLWGPGEGVTGKRKCCPSDLQGEEAPPWHPLRIREWPGKAFQGTNSRPHTFERAGNPDCVSRFARPTETPAYIGYYVGGGESFLAKHRCGGGAPPGPLQGTFGYDYAGICPRLRKFIVLGFGQKKWQGGPGFYYDDGPYPKDIGPAIGELKNTPIPGHPLPFGEEEHEE